MEGNSAIIAVLILLSVHHQQWRWAEFDSRLAKYISNYCQTPQPECFIKIQKITS